jgi:hypothetical protein
MSSLYLLFLMRGWHRLNIKLDLQSLFGLYVHMCTHWLRPRTPPPLLDSYTRALLVSQDRRHLSVTPWWLVFGSGLFTISYPNKYKSAASRGEGIIMYSKYK